MLSSATPWRMAALAAVLTLLCGATETQAQTVFINEIHYDNAGGDVGEAIEIAGPAGTDLTGWSLVLYNGSNGTVYNTVALSGAIPSLGGGFGVVVENIIGIQNGSPDGIALVDASSTVVQFLSYEGSFVAVGGPANGLTSTDIGVSESSSTPVGNSLQLGGTGTTYGDFAWNSEAPETFGAFNTGQSFGGTSGPSDPLINEFVANHTGSDTDAFTEILGDPNTDYSAFWILEIEGDGTGAGTVDYAEQIGLSDANGFWLSNEDAENGTVTLLLVENFTGSVGNDLDTDNDGTLDSTPWTRIVDDVAVTDNGSGDQTYAGTVLAPGFDGGPFIPGGASRIPSGTDTDSVSDWTRNDFDGAGLPCCSPGTPEPGEALNTPGAVNEVVPTPAPDLVINEIDYDQPGLDTAEFVEIYNPGSTPASLSGVDLVFVNGNGGAIYETFALPSVSLAPGGYFVVCGDAGNVVNCDLDVSPNSNLIQNGAPDAVALVQGSTIIDAVSYEGDVAGYTEGTGTSANEDNSTPFISLARFPDGTDTDNNDADFSVRCVSPGGANLATSSNCSDPSAVLQVVINEVDADTPGSDNMEFVELFGAPNTPLDGLVLVFFNGSDDASYDAFDLDGFSTDANGFFLIGNAGVTPTPSLIFSGNGLQNGADAVALYLGDGSDFPNDTPVTTTALLDAIVYDTNDGDDAGLLVLLNPSQPQVDEDGGGDKDNHSNQRIPNGDGGQRNTDTYTQIPPTPGAVNSAPPALVEIFEIQGDGLASPFDGSIVTTLDNVVTAVGPQGFTIQTPDARDDADPNTSNGIYVFTGGAPTVAVGDQVDVTAEVDEFFELTELTNAVVTVDGPGTLPTPIVFDSATPSPDPTATSCTVSGGGDFDERNFECFEGMLVTLTGGTVGQGNLTFGSDPIAEVSIVADSPRAFREEGIAYPGLPGLPVWDGNPEVFELDADRLGLPNLLINAGSTFDAVGVIGFDFGDYELWPSTLTVYPAPLPQPVRAVAPGEGTVASLNLFRLFDDVDDPPSTNPDGETRNDTVVPTAEYQTRLEKFSRYIREVLGAPDILAVQEVEKLEVLEDLADRILADGGPAYDAYLIEGNDVGTIDVGYLVRTDRVTVDAVTQLGATETYEVPGSGGDMDLTFDRPPLLLEGQFIGGREIAVLNLHLRSLGGIDGSDGDRVRAKRLAGAQSVAQKVDDFQAASDVGLAVVGDFNAYEFTDGYVHVVGRIQGDFDDSRDLESGPDLVDPNLTNQVLSLDPLQRYSFVFDGSAQVLDHALTTTTLNPAVTGFAYGRGNADAPRILLDDPSTALRSSDHDGLVLFLDVTPPEITLADPAVLWPPNHKYHTFSVEDFVTGVTEVPLANVFIQSVSSDEAENADGDGNTTDDIALVDCQTVDLRAERQGGGNGRVYTVVVAAVDAAGNEGTASYQVQVPPSKKGTAVDDGPAYTVESGCAAPAALAAQAQAAPEAATLATDELPEAFGLHANYPNPFNPTTLIAYDLPEATRVTLAVYNTLGQEVARLVDRRQSAGRYQVTFDGARLSSGVYFTVLRADGQTFTQKMLLMK